MALKELMIFSLLMALAITSLIAVTRGANSGTSGKGEVTFSKDVARIFYQHCAECHRPNDIGPFSVLTYKDVLPWVETISEKVRAREMPPWHADSRYGKFLNDRSLSREQIETIATWVVQGAKEGNPEDSPPLPKSFPGWRMGKPDYVLAMSEAYTIEAHAPDSYVYATFPTKLKEDMWVQAAEIVPGNRTIVHHVIAHVMTPEAIKGGAKRDNAEFPQTENAPTIFYKQGSLSRVRMDAPVIDDGANAPNGGSLFNRRTDDGASGDSVLLASYAPGKGPDIYPPGTAKFLPAGSTIILQIHYSSFHGAIETPQKDRTIVGLIFAKEPPEKKAVTFTVPNHFFKIPAGAANHRVTAAYTFNQDVQLISYMPHMHMRGKDMKYEVVFPDGRRQTLLWVPKYQFNWQTVYRLKDPMMIPRGTRIIVTAHFDNSAKNMDNPDPTKPVRWGDPSYDEMMIGWMEYLVPNGKKTTLPTRSNSP
jgi:mono/diheme cytochrome c family protein